MQLDALFLRLLHGVDGLRPLQPCAVNICYHQQGGLPVTVQGIVDGAQPHGTHRCQQGQLAPLFNAHFMYIRPRFGVIHGVIGAHDAAHRLGQGAVEIYIGVVGQQAVHQQRLHRNAGILGGPAAVRIGVAGRHQGAIAEVSGLDGKMLAHLVLAPPVLPYGHDIAAELMAHNRGMLRYVVGNTLVFRALYGSLVGRHAHTVGNNLYLNIVGTHLRQNDVLQPQVHFPVDAYRFRIHSASPFFSPGWVFRSFRGQ